MITQSSYTPPNHSEAATHRTIFIAPGLVGEDKQWKILRDIEGEMKRYKRSEKLADAAYAGRHRGYSTTGGMTEQELENWMRVYRMPENDKSYDTHQVKLAQRVRRCRRIIIVIPDAEWRMLKKIAGIEASELFGPEPPTEHDVQTIAYLASTYRKPWFLGAEVSMHICQRGAITVSGPDLAGKYTYVPRDNWRDVADALQARSSTGMQNHERRMIADQHMHDVLVKQNGWQRALGYLARFAYNCSLVTMEVQEISLHSIDLMLQKLVLMQLGYFNANDLEYLKNYFISDDRSCTFSSASEVALMFCRQGIISEHLTIATQGPRYCYTRVKSDAAHVLGDRRKHRDFFYRAVKCGGGGYSDWQIPGSWDNGVWVVEGFDCQLTVIGSSDEALLSYGNQTRSMLKGQLENCPPGGRVYRGAYVGKGLFVELIPSNQHTEAGCENYSMGRVTRIVPTQVQQSIIRAVAPHTVAIHGMLSAGITACRGTGPAGVRLGVSTARGLAALRVPWRWCVPDIPSDPAQVRHHRLASAWPALGLGIYREVGHATPRMRKVRVRAQNGLEPRTEARKDASCVRRQEEVVAALCHFRCRSNFYQRPTSDLSCSAEVDTAADPKTHAKVGHAATGDKLSGASLTRRQDQTCIREGRRASGVRGRLVRPKQLLRVCHRWL